MKRRLVAAAAALFLSAAVVPAAHAQPALSSDIVAGAETSAEGVFGVAFLSAFIGINLSSLVFPICSILNTPACVTE